MAELKNPPQTEGASLEDLIEAAKQTIAAMRDELDVVEEAIECCEGEPVDQDELDEADESVSRLSGHLMKLMDHIPALRMHEGREAEEEKV